MSRILRVRPQVLLSKMASTSTPKPGMLTTAKLKVSSSDLASAISTEPQDAFPDVFATSRLVAIMEIASARALQHLLQPGQLSVGVSLDVTHSAPTPPGATVTAEATYVGQERNLYVFNVVARDQGGEVGKAVHKRAIVDRERLEVGARKRNGITS